MIYSLCVMLQQKICFWHFSRKFVFGRIPKILFAIWFQQLDIWYFTSPGSQHFQNCLIDLFTNSKNVHYAMVINDVHFLASQSAKKIPKKMPKEKPL